MYHRYGCIKHRIKEILSYHPLSLDTSDFYLHPHHASFQKAPLFLLVYNYCTLDVPMFCLDCDGKLRKAEILTLPLESTEENRLA